MSLWVPPRVSKELFEERLEYEQVAQLMFEMEEPDEALNRAVSGIDPDSAVFRAKPTVRTGFPIKPGYWHFLRRNQGAPMTIEVIEGPDGEYIEPTASGLERMLLERDLQNPRVMQDFLRREEARSARAEREQQRLRAEVDDEVLGRVTAATRTQVSMNRDVAWSQNAAGRRDAKERSR